MHVLRLRHVSTTHAVVLIPVPLCTSMRQETSSVRSLSSSLKRKRKQDRICLLLSPSVNRTNNVARIHTVPAEIVSQSGHATWTVTVPTQATAPIRSLNVSDHSFVQWQTDKLSVLVVSQTVMASFVLTDLNDGKNHVQTAMSTFVLTLSHASWTVVKKPARLFTTVLMVLKFVFLNPSTHLYRVHRMMIVSPMLNTVCKEHVRKVEHAEILPIVSILATCTPFLCVSVLWFVKKTFAVCPTATGSSAVRGWSLKRTVLTVISWTVPKRSLVPLATVVAATITSLMLKATKSVSPRHFRLIWTRPLRSRLVQRMLIVICLLLNPAKPVMECNPNTSVVKAYAAKWDLVAVPWTVIILATNLP
mmetsp:Transcript_57075/g.139067  ORF Transcript_57075/g.139067 Transcript_57075/m.139067 type:complete len:362 (-) Transcript_57075:329-1414(-)